MNYFKLLVTLIISLGITEVAQARANFHQTKLDQIKNHYPNNFISQTNTSNASTVEISVLEKEVIDEINRVRFNPSAYADELEKLKQYYDGNNLTLPGRETVTTEEGVKAVDEAIEFLRSTDSLPPLRVSAGMSMAAKDHAQDQNSTENISHTGNDGSNLTQRVSRYGTAEISVAQSINYTEKTAQDVVRSFIISDGLSGRGDRQAILSTGFRFTGIGCGSHTIYENICVVVYAQGFNDNGNLALVYAETQVTEEELTPESEVVATETEANTETTETEPESNTSTTEPETPDTESEANTSTTEPETTETETDSSTSTTQPETPETESETPDTEPESSTSTTEPETPDTVEEENVISLDVDNVISLPLLQNGVLEEGDNQLPSDKSFYDTYAFSGNAGQSVTISIESADFDTYVMLIDPEYKQIAENDDISQENRNSAITIELPKNGTYVVIVNSVDASGKGNYTLTVNE